ncbi:MAG: aminodeoxychorismate/anthranilate synthase component II [Candidatus Micrarchaeota archaeon]|nr:aminodeoxychorismate/anthranilate synthase component II [Candidatus Micrarchaeota archaeon]
MKLLVLDNFDSFTYNLVQLFQVAGAECLVFRNNVSFMQVQKLKPDAVLISPGPGTVENPKDFGVCAQVIRELDVPQLGVCLGHQGIAHAFGGKILRDAPVHGKTSLLKHNGEGLFAGVKNPFQAARYHSLVVDEKTLPDCLEVTARGPKNEIMGLRHKKRPLYGVQFHPESFITQEGAKMADNFLKLV